MNAKAMVPAGLLKYLCTQGKNNNVQGPCVVASDTVVYFGDVKKIEIKGKGQR